MLAEEGGPYFFGAAFAEMLTHSAEEYDRLVDAFRQGGAIPITEMGRRSLLAVPTAAAGEHAQHFEKDVAGEVLPCGDATYTVAREPYRWSFESTSGASSSG